MDPVASHPVLSLLGVAFRLPAGLSLTRNAAFEAIESVEHPLRELCADALHRQKRRTVTYIDAMTGILRSHPKHISTTEVFGLAADLCFAVGLGDVPDHMILELDRFAPLQSLRQSFGYRLEASSQPRIIDVPNLALSQLETAPSGRDGLGEGRVRRRLRIDVTGLPADLASIDWFLLSLYAVLAHLKCDLETMLDTGFLRIRRCQRLACGAFYRVPRMAGRSRFCSATCRACAAREQ